MAFEVRRLSNLAGYRIAVGGLPTRREAGPALHLWMAEHFRPKNFSLQERDDDLARAAVPPLTREDFTLFTTRESLKINSQPHESEDAGCTFARHRQVVGRKPTLTDTCRHKEQ